LSLAPAAESGQRIARLGVIVNSADLAFVEGVDLPQRIVAGARLEPPAPRVRTLTTTRSSASRMTSISDATVEGSDRSSQLRRWIRPLNGTEEVAPFRGRVDRTHEVQVRRICFRVQLESHLATGCG
jgi:hypothetical protein